MKPFDCNWKNPGMELFSSRRWATGSAQQSNNYGIMPCMCCIIFLGLTNSFLLGPIQPSSPTGKELHDPGQHHTIMPTSYTGNIIQVSNMQSFDCNWKYPGQRQKYCSVKTSSSEKLLRQFSSCFDEKCLNQSPPNLSEAGKRQSILIQNWIPETY